MTWRATTVPDLPLLPDYAGACLSGVVPALFGQRAGLDEQMAPPAWLPQPCVGARQIVLVVLDGLGWEQLRAKADLAPFLAGMVGGPITSVVPSTTAAALTSIVTGTPPASHGLIGYRLIANGEVLNVLKWQTPYGDARQAIKPEAFQEVVPFCGHKPPVVSRAEFAGSGFTAAHLAGIPLVGWRLPSSIHLEVVACLREGAPFVYVYYDGIDKIAHDKGLGEYFDAELVATDALVARIYDALPAGCALAVTADHGQVEVLDDPIVLDRAILTDVEMLSGEGRFRWLHTREGTTEAVRAACEQGYGDVAWVRTRDELDNEGWFGAPLRPHIAARLGDVALIARAPVAFFDPADTGELRLVARHGSVTRDEMLVPFVALSS